MVPWCITTIKSRKYQYSTLQQCQTLKKIAKAKQRKKKMSHLGSYALGWCFYWLGLISYSCCIKVKMGTILLPRLSHFTCHNHSELATVVTETHTVQGSLILWDKRIPWALLFLFHIQCINFGYISSHFMDFSVWKLSVFWIILWNNKLRFSWITRNIFISSEHNIKLHTKYSEKNTRFAEKSEIKKCFEGLTLPPPQ